MCCAIFRADPECESPYVQPAGSPPNASTLHESVPTRSASRASVRIVLRQELHVDLFGLNATHQILVILLLLPLSTIAAHQHCAVGIGRGCVAACTLQYGAEPFAGPDAICSRVLDLTAQMIEAPRSFHPGTCLIASTSPSRSDTSALLPPAFATRSTLSCSAPLSGSLQRTLSGRLFLHMHCVSIRRPRAPDPLPACFLSADSARAEPLHL